jgi:hypothetical protein
VAGLNALESGSELGAVFQYEVVPVMLTRGAGESEAGSQCATLRAGLNERGRVGFRVVAVSDGAEGRAIIMEREVEDAATSAALTASRTVSEGAEDITRESAGGRGSSRLGRG